MAQGKKRSGNPFRGIYIPKDPQELLDIAFRRAMKVSAPGGIRLLPSKKLKSKAITTIQVLSQVLFNKLMDIVRSMPSVEEMHPFYLSTMQIWMSKDDYKKSLAKIQGAAFLIQRLARDYTIRIRSVKKEETKPFVEFRREIEKLKKEAYGRISSVVKSLKKELEALSDLVRKMSKLPDYDPSMPAIVVAGPPNTGKSSFVRAVSNARVEVASYPFTTKNITFGHIEFADGMYIKVQIADTPGIFDRSLEERNEIELLAIKAIESLADVIIFLFDGSIEGILTPEEQMNVYRTVKEVMKNKPIIVAINKMDIADPEVVRKLEELMRKEGITSALKISVEKRININSVLDAVRAILTQLLSNSSFQDRPYSGKSGSVEGSEGEPGESRDGEENLHENEGSAEGA